MTRLWEGMTMRFEMRRVFSILASVSVLVVSCRKSESPGAAAVPPISTVSAPAPTPDAYPPFGILDVPRETATVEAGSWGYGWALDDSGVAAVQASVDGGPQIFVKLGQPFPGVKEANPNIPDNDKAGFIFAVPRLPPGPHAITIVILARDGGRTEISRRFQIK
jgi:hypothetical protein